MSCLQKMHVLDEIDARFARAFDGPLVISGVPLAELRGVMLDRTVEVQEKDAVWRELLQNARQQRTEWQLAALWMMLPGLRGIVARWSGGSGLDTKDLESEAVTGFLEAIRDVNLEGDAIGARLWWAVKRRVQKATCHMRKEFPVEDVEVAGGRTEEVAGNPLGEAVHDGVISDADAKLISSTRLEGERLGSVAERLGLRYHACQRRRARAEARLAGYLLIDGDRPLPPKVGQAEKAQKGAA